MNSKILDINKRNKYEWTSFVIVCYYNHLDRIKYRMKDEK